MTTPSSLLNSSDSRTHTIRLFLGEKGRKNLPLSDLVWLRAEANYTWLVWRDGEQMLMPRTLKHYESFVPARKFVRLHRHCLINIDFIESVQNEGAKRMTIRLQTGEAIVVARRRVALVRQHLSEFSGNGQLLS
jgi:DNA-binding LytR/AlgR family response regulator